MYKQLYVPTVPVRDYSSTILKGISYWIRRKNYFSTVFMVRLEIVKSYLTKLPEEIWGVTLYSLLLREDA